MFHKTLWILIRKVNLLVLLTLENEFESEICELECECNSSICPYQLHKDRWTTANRQENRNSPEIRSCGPIGVRVKGNGFKHDWSPEKKWVKLWRKRAE